MGGHDAAAAGAAEDGVLLFGQAEDRDAAPAGGFRRPGGLEQRQRAAFILQQHR